MAGENILAVMIIVVDLSSRREKARNLFSKSQGRYVGRAAWVSAQIPVGAQKLKLEGIIFMR